MSEPALRRPHRSAFVSLIAWLGILSGGSGVLAFGIFMVVQPSFQFVLGLLGAIAGLATAIGMWKRREWARQGFIVVLAYSSVMGLISAVRFRALQLSTVVPAGAEPTGMTQAQLDALTTTMRTGLLIVTGVVTLINVLIILKLRTQRVREEFGAESAV